MIGRLHACCPQRGAAYLLSVDLYHFGYGAVGESNL